MLALLPTLAAQRSASAAAGSAVRCMLLLCVFSEKFSVPTFSQGSHRSLPSEVRVVALSTNHCAETIVATLVHGVMARLAEDDAVVDRVRSPELDVPKVVGLRALAKPVFRSPCVTKPRNVRATTGAPKSLPSDG